jgi:hypothetical protein
MKVSFLFALLFQVFILFISVKTTLSENTPNAGASKDIRDSRRHRQLKKFKATPKAKTTKCPKKMVDKDLDCNTVAAMYWLLTTDDGINALQDEINAAQGMTWNEINDKYEDHNTNIRMLKAGKAAKGGIKRTKCPKDLVDPTLNCETLEAVVWFLTTDDGMGALKGLTSGMSLYKINQRYALVSFYYGLEESSREMLADDYGWLDGDECDWLGTGYDGGASKFECNDVDEISSIFLNGMELEGMLSSELRRITTLEWLELYDNKLRGTVPTELTQLRDLKYLDLGKNQFTGTIPKVLGKLINLNYLYLDENELTGEIPKEMGKLVNLVLLYLNNNKLSGSIPEELGQLGNLEVLELHDNELSGSMPDDVCRLKEDDKLSFLTADCKEFAAYTVTCDCCDECYPK